VSEKQFRSYVDKALKTPDPVQSLFVALERRLDNVLFRSGLSKTRAQARQAASHGHIMINNKRVTVPSILLSKGDTISIRASSATGPLFGEATERMKTLALPLWFKTDPDSRTVTVEGLPVYVAQEHVFDLVTVIEFYNR
jgi:small subunit ribosomal protein S4